MVDTKDQSNAIVYWVGILFVDTVNMKIKACNAFNAMFVNSVDIKDQSNVIVYWIAILFVDTVDMKIKACNAFIAMFVDSVDISPLCSLSSIVQPQYQYPLIQIIDKPCTVKPLIRIDSVNKIAIHNNITLIFCVKPLIRIDSVNNPEGFSSGIWNVLLKSACLYRQCRHEVFLLSFMSTLLTNIALFEMFYINTLIRIINSVKPLIRIDSVNKIATQYTITLLWSFMSTLLTNIALFEMFYINTLIRIIDSVKPLIWIDSVNNPEGFSSGIWNVLLKSACLYRQCRHELFLCSLSSIVLHQPS